MSSQTTPTSDAISFINSIEDFFVELKKFEPTINKEPSSQDHPFLLWFRGQATFQYSLVPSLFRKYKFSEGIHIHSTSTSSGKEFWSEIYKKEFYYLKDFRNRNYHTLSHLPENDLLWMIYMQHYGTPTRLMDWSESAMSAFFFALENYFTTEPKNVDGLPCIWCLKPKMLNSIAREKYHINNSMDWFPDFFFNSASSSDYATQAEENKRIQEIFFPTDLENSPAYDYWPMAIIPPYNNERIRAQAGTFTLFPFSKQKDVKRLQDLSMDRLDGFQDFLKIFILQKPSHISAELKAIGLKRSHFYPELPASSYDIEQEQNLHLR